MYLLDWQGGRGNVTHGGMTILAAIKQTVSPETKIIFSPGGNDLPKADAVVVVIARCVYRRMLPGTEGRGMTDVLFGDFKFTGKLPRNWPRQPAKNLQ